MTEYYIVYYQDYEEIDLLRIFASKEQADDFAARYSAHFKDRPVTIESANDDPEFDTGFHHWRVTALQDGTTTVENQGFHTYACGDYTEKYTARNLFSGPAIARGYRATVIADTEEDALAMCMHKFRADLEAL